MILRHDPASTLENSQLHQSSKLGGIVAWSRTIHGEATRIVAEFPENYADELANPWLILHHRTAVKCL
jgi:hypothetical protein